MIKNKMSFCFRYICIYFCKFFLFIIPIAYITYGTFFMITNPIQKQCSLTWKYNFLSIIITNIERLIFYILYKKKIRNKKTVIVSLLIELSFLSWGVYEIFFGECNFEKNIKLIHLSFLTFLVGFIFFLFYLIIIITNIRQRTTGFSQDPRKLLDEIILLEKQRESEEGPSV